MGGGDRDPEGKFFEEDTDESSLFFKCFCPETTCSFSGSTEALQEHLTKDHQIPLRDFRYGETLRIPLASALPFEVLKGEDGNIFVLCFTQKKGLTPSPLGKRWRSNAVFVVSVQPPNSDLTPQFMFTLKVMEGPVRSNDCTSGFRLRYRNKTTSEVSYFRLRWWVAMSNSKPVPRSTLKLKDLYEHVLQGLVFKHINIHKRPADAYLCIQACPVSEQVS